MTSTPAPGAAPAAPLDLASYVAAGAISAADIAAAALLVEMGRQSSGCDPLPLEWVAMCLALSTPRDGHTCVD